MNEVGAPVHDPTNVVSVCPAWNTPDTDGATIAAGLAAVPLPAGVTASVGGERAPAVPAGVVAATASTSAWPTSAVPGLYVSRVAPGIATQPEPAGLQRSH